jgi:hypothetical protein
MLSGTPLAAVLDPLFAPATAPAVFAVVGEHRNNPDRLLLLGDDGRYYAYETSDGVPVPVDLTPDWVVDAA